MLPLLPQSYMVLFGAEAAGIVNPVNPMLEVGQIAEILKAAGTKVLVTLGPTPGTEIWDKSQHVRKLVPSLERVDRKSTRLNSSHITISYAVFCLKKKKKKKIKTISTKSTHDNTYNITQP